MANSTEKQKRENLVDMFIQGARKGWQISTNSMLPNVVMAFVVIQILNVTGLMKIIGNVARPLMAVFGLPGEGVVVLLSAFMSTGGGCGAAASLYGSGALNMTHVSILMPAIFLMGSMLQYLGRGLGTADANKKYWGLHVGISILNALLSMVVMRLIMAFF